MASLTHETRHNPETGRDETYWKIAYREDGKQRRLAIGFCPEREAKTVLERWNARRLLGIADPPPPVAPPSLPTLREWWADGARMSTWIAARGLQLKMPMQCARPAILRELGDVRLDAVTTAKVDELLGAWRARGYRSRTCQLYVDWLRRSLEVALGDGLVASVPAFTPVRVTDKKEHRWLMPEQTAALFAQLDKEVRADPQAVMAIRVAETFLLRPGEVLTRRWTDLVRDGWTAGVLLIRPVVLPNGSTWRPKARSDRALPLPLDLLTRLRDEWIRQGQPTAGWMFPSPVDSSKPLGTFRGALKGACERAKVPLLHPHALRHTGATRLALSGTSRKTLMAIGGWTSGAMLDGIYEHTADSEIARALGVVTQPVLPSPKVPAGDS